VQVLEDVKVSGFKRARVERVEALHEHKRLEQHGVEHALVGGVEFCVLGMRQDPFLICKEGSVFIVWKIPHVLAPQEDHHHPSNLIDGLSQDIAPHHCVNDGLVPVLRQPVEQFGSGWLSCKSQCSKCVHDQVNPQHLHGCEGHCVQAKRANKHNHEGNDVNSQLELQELAHAVIDVATVLHCTLNISKVVFEKHNVAGAFGHVGSTSHGEAHVGLLKCGRVICAVTCNSYHFFELLQTRHKRELIVWGAPSKHTQLIRNLLELLYVANLVFHDHVTLLVLLILTVFLDGERHEALHSLDEVSAIHANVARILIISVLVRSDDSCISSDRSCSVNKVTSAHAYVDACLVQSCHGFSYVGAERIFKTKDICKHHVAFQLPLALFIGQLQIVILLGREYFVAAEDTSLRVVR